MIGISTDDVEVRLKAIELFFQELSKEGVRHQLSDSL